MPFKEINDGFGHLGADAGKLGQLLAGCLLNGIHAAKMLRQKLCRLLAHMVYAKAGQKAGQGGILPCCFQGLDKIGGQLLAHAVIAHELLFSQRKELGRRFDAP